MTGPRPGKGPAWTAEQVRAITSPDDALLMASAGTGKTTTVVGKVLWLLGVPYGVSEETGEPLPLPPDPCGLPEIAAVTFTEKAAHDLKAKLREAIVASERRDLLWDLERASIGTIHSFAGALLREHALRLGLDPTFRVFDERETRAELDRVVREVVLEELEAEAAGGPRGAALLYREFKLGGTGYRKGLADLVRETHRDLRWHAERYAGWSPGEGGGGAAGLDLERLRALAAADDPAGADAWSAEDDVVALHCDALVRMARRAGARWEAFQEEENVRDFDSLILHARALLTGGHAGPALEAMRRRYRILIIDEFQDTDFAQKDIAFAIARGVPRPQLLLVGDPKQSIYRFRGADVSVWNEVARELHPDGEPLTLSRNFRSLPAVVDFVNEVASAAMEEAGAALAPEDPDSVVGYAPLVAARPHAPPDGIEWLVSPADWKAEERRAREGEHAARRIREMVGEGFPVTDPDDGHTRPCRFRDFALLFRSRTGIEHYEAALGRHGIPFHHSGAPRTRDRQEVLDVLTALRLLENRRDDVRAFAWLRSPFVGLRDEVIARLRIEGHPRHPLLLQAKTYLERVESGETEWFEAPEDPRIAAREREALAEGLERFDELERLARRLPLDELIEALLERSGYRLHLLLLGRQRETFPHLQSLVRVAGEHRDRPLGTFLEIWDRWNDQDLGVPQAALHSKDDDVVTLSTIHSAKGLEWPVVLFADVGGERVKPRTYGTFLTDPRLGPVLCVRNDDLGSRGGRARARHLLEEDAESARLLYVAMTRARDRLVVVGPREAPSRTEKSYGLWLDRGGERAEVRAELPELAPAAAPPPLDLSWMDAIEERPAPALVRPLPEPPLRFVTSATERMMLAADPERWRKRYRHGVQEVWEFDPAGSGIPAHVRGTVIHGTLERLEEESELARILDEVIGELDAPELEDVLAPGTAYRRALEEEIETVVRSPQWAWYVEGEHRRELAFAHLAGDRDWRMGSFDLWRPTGPPPGAAAELGLDAAAAAAAWIVDFKTHRIEADAVAAKAEEYRVQVEVYREAARAAAGSGPPAGDVRVRLHFTHPNEVVDME